MTEARNRPPPFGPVLLAGLAARPLPKTIVESAAKRLAEMVWRRHPGLLDRLDLSEPKFFCIDPTDLPFAFALRLDPTGLDLRVSDEVVDDPVTATIRGSLLALIDLAEGRVDGDTLFFTRALEFEGDTEAVLALRNALDAEDINVREVILDALGPLAGPARRISDLGARVLGRVADDLDLIHRSIIAPIARRSDAHGAAIADIDERLDAVERRQRRRQKADA